MAVFCTFISKQKATIGAFVMGNGLGWTSPALPAIQTGDITHIVTKEEASWIGSLFAIGALIASQVWLIFNLLQFHLLKKLIRLE